MTPLIHMLFSADGRIRRRDWWLYSVMICLLSGVFFFVLFFVMAILASLKILGSANGNAQMAPILGDIYFPFFCWMIVCVTSKRWHDRGKSGYMSVLSFVPVIGTIWTLIECGILDGLHGPNKFGPSPKGLNHEENLF